MRIYAPAGCVKVRVWSRDSIDVAGTIAAGASLFGGGSRDAVKFGVEAQRTGDTRLPAVDWVVTVPRNARVWVKMTSGRIESDGSSGELELYAVSGSITVRDATGVTSIESIDADVGISSSSGDVRIRSGKARVELRDMRGTASITTVNGPVFVRGASAPDGRIETIGGPISIEASQLRGAVLDLQTHSGPITAVVPRRAVPLLDLVSRTGTVTNPARGGAATWGKITARSFRGTITVRIAPN